jgi:dephospho-CoA kinase
MIKVGITGGIGSGKTTVCKLFAAKGIAIYYADDRAKKIMTANRFVKSEIIKLFGQEAYYKNGRLNRKYLSSKIFNDKTLLEKMNAVVHPVVKNDGIEWFRNQSGPFAIKEAALLIEAGSYKDLDKIIIVTCPEDIRIQRVMQRDKSKKEDVKKRIKNQMPESEKVKFAHYIIINDGVVDLKSQVDKIYNELSK